jgi:small subunit ribosomal protein S8
MITDPVGDFIVRLKNAGDARKTVVAVPYSKLKNAIALVLKQHGFVTEVSETGSGIKRTLSVTLAYDADGAPKIRGAKRISKPGRRLYAGVKDVHPVRYGKGIMVLSTPRGILSDAEARKLRAGGETLFSIW